MDKTSVGKIVDLFCQGLKTKGIHPKKIILFGSYALGTHTEDSDIDILVVSDDFKCKDYWERIDIMADVIYDIFEPIEAIGLTSDELDNKESFSADYALNGEVLYAA
jgi:uncharacterized protein